MRAEAVSRLVGWMGLLLCGLVMPAHAAPPGDYAPPEFWQGVRAGDSYDRVKAQPGWTECGGASRTQLCHHDPGPKGDTEAFVLKFLGERAFSGKFGMAGAENFLPLYRRFQLSGSGNTTTIRIKTLFVEVDLFKDMHELGVKNALLKALPLIDPKNVEALLELQFVPRRLEEGARYRNADEYLEALPPGALVLTAQRNPLREVNIAVIMFELNLADKKIVFPEYCVDQCKSWRMPEGN